ncbi:hypothetical protein HDU98_001696, partial [Podochytrium sp. JEL0797]
QIETDEYCGVSIYFHTCPSLGTSTSQNCDPRTLARKLTKKGSITWLDVDRLKHGESLFENLAEAIKPCHFAVVCVSDEYVNSVNCKREFTFLNNRRIPYVIVVVGANEESKWAETGVGFQAGDTLYIEAHKEDEKQTKIFQRILEAVEGGVQQSLARPKRNEDEDEDGEEDEEDGEEEQEEEPKKRGFFSKFTAAKHNEEDDDEDEEEQKKRGFFSKLISKRNDGEDDDEDKEDQEEEAPKKHGFFSNLNAKLWKKKTDDHEEPEE